MISHRKNRFILRLVVTTGLIVCVTGAPSHAQQLAHVAVAPWMDEDLATATSSDDAPSRIDPLPLTLKDLEKAIGPVKDGRDAPSYALSHLTPLEIMYGGRAAETVSLFGYNLFSANKKASTSLPAGAVADDYILSAGDQIEVITRGQENARKIYDINSQGLLAADNLSPISAAGKTIREVRVLLERDAARLHNLQIHIALSAPRQIDIIVIGDVVEPGRKTLTAFHTVLDALQEAGGIQKTGSLRRVKLVRGGKGSFIDLYNVMMQGGDKADTRLRDGDRIIVPPIGATVAVTGAVKRPAIYEIRNGEELSALEMLGLAGGVLSPGSNRFVRMALTQDGREIVEDIDAPSKRVFDDGSILNVAQAKERRSHNVTISGAGRDAGVHDIGKSSTLSQLIGNENAFDDTTYPLLGVIARKDPKTLTRKLVEFSPSQVLRGDSDMDLAQGDTVHLFTDAQISSLAGGISGEPLIHKASVRADKINDPHILSFLRERAAFIRGSVRQPGAYPVASGTPVTALIGAAGGLTVEADRNNIEVSARTAGRDRLKIAYDETALISISAGDTVRVNQSFQRVEERSVSLLGEVNNPGKYDLRSGDTMSSLIKRAGGLSDTAYPHGVIFSRASERKQEEQRYKAQARDLEMKLAAQLQQKDDKNKPDAGEVSAARALISQLRDARAVGRITVQADPGILSHDPEQDILLEEGDKIYIPRRPLTVRVGGEVLSPAALQFRKGKKGDDYIREAGGTTYYADKRRAFVVYPDGSARPLSSAGWTQDSELIPPGSSIIIPRDPKPFDFLESAESITSILANIALTGFYIDDLGDDD